MKKIGTRFPCPKCKKEIEAHFAKPNAIFPSKAPCKCESCGQKYIGTFQKLTGGMVNVQVKAV